MQSRSPRSVTAQAFVRSVCLVVVLLGSAPARSAEPRVEGGRLEFALPDLDGESVAHDDPRFAGRVVLITLWGTWCPPCITEIPTFNDLQARLGERGLVIVGIAFERKGDLRQRRAKLQAFMKKYPIEYLVLDGGLTKDAATALPALRDVKGLPVEILVGRDGRVHEARNGYGYSEEWARKLEAKLTKMLERPGDEVADDAKSRPTTSEAPPEP